MDGFMNNMFYNPYAGLLGPEEDARLQQAARSQGLLNIAANLLAAGGPSTTPQGLGQALARGVIGGQQAAQDVYMQGVRSVMIKQQMDEQKRMRDARERLRTQLSGAMAPTMTMKDVTAAQSNIDPMELEAMSAQQVLGQATPTGPMAPDVAAQNRAVMNYLMEADPVKYAELVSTREKTPSDIQKYQYAVSQGYTGSYLDFEKDLRAAGAPKTTIPISVGTEKKYGEQFGSALAQQDSQLYATAREAPGRLGTIQETRRLLDTGKVFVGAFANEKLFLAAAGQALGVGGKDTNEIVTNTQRLFANRAQATLDSIKASGLGAGQGFTDRDREFLEKARLGNIKFTADALKQQLDIEEKIAKAQINAWNTRYGSIPKSALEGTGVGRIELPEMPAASTKKGQRRPLGEIFR